MFDPLSPRELDSWADADPITTADKETISMAMELREARKKIATLVTALENVEWIGDPTGEYNWTACPSCYAVHRIGTGKHEPDCELAKALAQC